MTMLTVMIMLVGVLFMFSSHPLMLGFLLMIFSVLCGFSIYLINLTPWLSYILIMVFLSGMMVMFIYMASLSSNEPMSLNMNYSVPVTMLILMLIFSFSTELNMSHTNLVWGLSSSHSLELVYKTYNNTLGSFTILFIIYLLLVLIISVKITLLDKGPLRYKK